MPELERTGYSAAAAYDGLGTHDILLPTQGEMQRGSFPRRRRLHETISVGTGCGIGMIGAEFDGTIFLQRIIVMPSPADASRRRIDVAGTHVIHDQFVAPALFSRSAGRSTGNPNAVNTDPVADIGQVAERIDSPGNALGPETDFGLRVPFPFRPGTSSEQTEGRHRKQYECSHALL